MKNPRFICKYSCAGKEIILEGKNSEYLDADYTVTDKKINLTLKPKGYVELIEAYFEFDHEFLEDDKFFANGYQSWSTSREYTKNDTSFAYNRLITTCKAEKLAGVSAAWFCNESLQKGVFASHCYTYIKNNEKYFFIGSLSERQGYTVFTGDMNRNILTISKDVEGVATDKDYDLFDLVILEGSEAEVFDGYFDQMGVKKPKIKHLAGYTSWYNYFQKINEGIILRDLKAMDKVHDDVNIFQIDDGYETFVGDWLDPNPAKFPNGMKAIADSIHEKGYMAGIWLAPFNVQIKSRTYREHPDWIIRDKKGRPVIGCLGWGGAYTLDIYNPEAREYIRHVFDVVLNDWGYDMVKLDFLYSQCQIPRYNKSRGTIMCEAMEFLRECCGDKLILGCGVPLGPAFGYVDACRISCDVDLSFRPKFYNKMNLCREMVSAQNAINNSIFRRQLNGRVFTNDPDVFFLRYSNLKFELDQKILLGFINHICGDVLFVSDNMEEYTDNDIEIVRKFYSESDFKVIDANYVENSNKILLKLLDKENKIRMLWFNIETGYGNQGIISGISANR